MGRPYSKELDMIPPTYAWANRAPIGDLVELVKRCAEYPLYAVGSGGSFTSATFASALHQQGGKISKCMTPLEFVWHPHLDGDARVAIVTAGGNNKDILASFDKAVASAPLTGIVSTATKSRLIRRAGGTKNVLVHAACPPSGRDGFLATNSLISTMLWLSRAYIEELSLPYEIPKFARLASCGPGAFEKARSKKTLVVLHDDWGKTAAVDAESKMVEAGLANVQISDYRNFAHGRHNWLDKASSETCVVAMITPQCLGLADRTMGLIPTDVPVVRLATDFDGPAAAIDLTLQAFRMVEFFGAVRGIDPGRPGVKDFGRRIYGIGVPSVRKDGLADFERLALRRKFGSAGSKAKSRQKSLGRFVSKMLRQEFGAVVFDYDGTLCDDGRRFEGPAPEIGSMLAGLVRRGVSVGVATGRGESARAQLTKLLPGKYHAGVLIGYHNGSQIGSLADRDVPDPHLPPDEALHSAFEALQTRGFQKNGASAGPAQISLRLPNPDARQVQRLVEESGVAGVKAVESGHSVDLLAPGVSKLSLFCRIKERLPKGRKILCIGDRGRWPGNDHELLGTEYSLSVDEASEDPSRCWNLLPAHKRGADGTLHYMGWFGVRDGFVKLEKNLAEMRGSSAAGRRR